MSDHSTIYLHDYKIERAPNFIRLSRGYVAQCAFGRAAHRASRLLDRLLAADDDDLRTTLCQWHANGFKQ